MIRRTLQRLHFPGAIVLSIWVVIVLAVHATVRDRQAGFSVIFYSSPWVLIALGSAGLTIYWHWRRQRWLWMPLLLVSAQAVGIWLTSEFRWQSRPPVRGELRVVQWNVDRPNWRLPGDVAWLRAQDADIITIAEDQPKKLATLDRWKTAFPDYQVVKSPLEMLCLIRGEVRQVEQRLLYNGSQAALIRVSIKGRDISVIQTDINASIGRMRDQPLTALAGFVAEHRDENLFVAGDFNTPLNSALLEPLRAVASNAFETAGRGFAATWPMPFPVLSLDQVWTTGQLRPVRCENGFSWRSDHRAMITEFNFAPNTSDL